jgi:hypothetical protein
LSSTTSRLPFKSYILLESIYFFSESEFHALPEISEPGEDINTPEFSASEIFHLRKFSMLQAVMTEYLPKEFNSRVSEISNALVEIFVNLRTDSDFFSGDPHVSASAEVLGKAKGMPNNKGRGKEGREEGEEGEGEADDEVVVWLIKQLASSFGTKKAVKIKERKEGAEGEREGDARGSQGRVKGREGEKQGEGARGEGEPEAMMVEEEGVGEEGRENKKEVQKTRLLSKKGTAGARGEGTGKEGTKTTSREDQGEGGRKIKSGEDRGEGRGAKVEDRGEGRGEKITSRGAQGGQGDEERGIWFLEFLTHFISEIIRDAEKKPGNSGNSSACRNDASKKLSAVTELTFRLPCEFLFLENGRTRHTKRFFKNNLALSTLFLPHLLPSSFFLLPSSFFLLPSSFFLPSSFLLLPHLGTGQFLSSSIFSNS